MESLPQHNFKQALSLIGVAAECLGDWIKTSKAFVVKEVGDSPIVLISFKNPHKKQKSNPKEHIIFGIRKTITGWKVCDTPERPFDLNSFLKSLQIDEEFWIRKNNLTKELTIIEQKFKEKRNVVFEKEWEKTDKKSFGDMIEDLTEVLVQIHPEPNSDNPHHAFCLRLVKDEWKVLHPWGSEESPFDLKEFLTTNKLCEDPHDVIWIKRRNYNDEIHSYFTQEGIHIDEEFKQYDVHDAINNDYHEFLAILNENPNQTISRAFYIRRNDQDGKWYLINVWGVDNFEVGGEIDKKFFAHISQKHYCLKSWIAFRDYSHEINTQHPNLEQHWKAHVDRSTLMDTTSEIVFTIGKKDSVPKFTDWAFLCKEESETKKWKIEHVWGRNRKLIGQEFSTELAQKGEELYYKRRDFSNEFLNIADKLQKGAHLFAHRETHEIKEKENLKISLEHLDFALVYSSDDGKSIQNGVCISKDKDWKIIYRFGKIAQSTESLSDFALSKKMWEDSSMRLWYRGFDLIPAEKPEHIKDISDEKPHDAWYVYKHEVIDSHSDCEKLVGAYKTRAEAEYIAKVNETYAFRGPQQNIDWHHISQYLP